MWILNEQEGKIIDLENGNMVALGRDVKSISFFRGNGQITKIKEYETTKEAKEAIKMITESMNLGREEVYTLPDAEKIKSRIFQKSDYENKHHVSGKKIKGHGGS